MRPLGLRPTRIPCRKSTRDHRECGTCFPVQKSLATRGRQGEAGVIARGFADACDEEDDELAEILRYG